MRQLCAAAAQEDRASLSYMAQTAQSGASHTKAETQAAEMDEYGKSIAGLWRPGLPPGIVYGPLLISVNAQVR